MHKNFYIYYKNEFIKVFSIYTITILLSIISGYGVSYNDETLKFVLALVFIFIYVSIGINNIYHAFYLFLFLSLTVWISKIIIFETISLLVGIGLILTILWVKKILNRNNKLLFLKEYWLIIGLIGTVIISTIINWGGEAGLGTVFTYIQLFILFILFTDLIKSKAQLFLLCKVIILSSTIIAIVILLDVIGILPSGVIEHYQTYIETERGFVRINRTSGIFDDPNFSAFQMVLAIPFIFEIMPFQKRIIKGLLIITLFIIITAINYTYSISGFIGMISVLIIKFLDNKDLSYKKIVNKILLLLIFVLLTPFIIPDYFIDRLMENILEIRDLIETKNISSFIMIGTTRGNTWQASIKSFLSSPIIGIGPGNSLYSNLTYNMLDKSVEILAPHNFILSIATDIGLIGLLFFGGLLFTSFISTKFNSKNINDSELKKIGNGINIALIACYIQGLGLDVHTSKHLWILMGMALSYKYICSSIIRNNNKNNLPIENA